MSNQSPLPRGGVDARKYAALALGLSMARGAIRSALDGDKHRAHRVLNLTATNTIASGLGLNEAELAINWSEHLTPEEVYRITGHT